MNFTRITSFTISRKTWLRGEGSKPSRLLRASDGKMCCVGSYLLAAGLTAKEIKGKATAGNVAGTSFQHGAPHEVFNLDRELVNVDIYGTNDDIEGDGGFTDARREAHLIKQFKKIGISVTFIE